MDENLKNLLKARLEASIMAFAKTHKIPLTGKVLRWDDWTTKTTADLWIRIMLDDDK